MINWDADVLGPVMDVFGDGVLYRPVAGAPFLIADAVFDEQYTFVLRDERGVEVNTTSPMLGVRAAVCPTAAQDDQVDVGTHNGRTVDKRYLVSDVRPDNHGHLVLLLSEVCPL